MNNYTRICARVDLDAIEYNMEMMKKNIKEGVQMISVIKTDGYGHGALQIARMLEGKEYLWGYAVATLDEAVVLRKGGIKKPILVLGCIFPDQRKAMIENEIRMTVYTEEMAKEVSELAGSMGKQAYIHIKLDTGMSRLGFLCSGAHFEEGVENVIRSCRLPGLVPEGIYTHFAVSDEPDEASRDYTLAQFALFMNFIAAVKERGGIRFPIRHCANSGAVVNYPQMALDMVRPGLLLYGYGDKGRLGLRPCMRLVTTVSTIKFYEPGTSVSYGRRYVTDKRCRMGVLAIGYADGLPRIISNKCSFAAQGGFAPQRGSICMDMCMVDLSDLPQVDVGSEVELFGEKNDIYALSDAACTIPYELLCAVSKRVPRVYMA